MGPVSLVIHGKPFAKQRPRFSRASGRAFTPAATVSFETAVRQLAIEHFPVPITGPVELRIVATFAPPPSWSGKKRAAHMGQPHTQKPDLDNIGKAICDGLNRVAFADDSQVCAVQWSKTWGEDEKTEVTVSARVAQ